MASTTQKTNPDDNDRMEKDYFDNGIAEEFLGNPTLMQAIERIAQKRQANARIRAMQRHFTPDEWRQEQGRVWELNFWAGLTYNVRQSIERKNSEKKSS